jgi:hypothetical protein
LWGSVELLLRHRQVGTAVMMVRVAAEHQRAVRAGLDERQDEPGLFTSEADKAIFSR